MKTYKKTYLPEFIVYKETLLKCNPDFDTWELRKHNRPQQVIKELKKQGRIAVFVEVLSARLKGKTDLWGQPYQPTKWIFSN